MASQMPGVSCSPSKPQPSQAIAGTDEPTDHLMPYLLRSPLLAAPVPSTTLLTGDSTKVLMKVKAIKQVGSLACVQPDQKNTNFILTQTPVKWLPPMPGVGLPQTLHTSNICQLLPTGRTVLFTKPAGVLQAMARAEDYAGVKRSYQAPQQALPVHTAWTAQGGLIPIPLQGPSGTGTLPGTGGTAPPEALGELSSASKGVYENFRRWQKYKELVLKQFPINPDTEALACFLIPVLRSLARMKPEMTIEEAVPRGIQEWERISNYDRMVFHEMAEKFMEFEEEEMQMMKVQLSAEDQAPQPKVATSTIANKPQVHLPKKPACKASRSKRRQRRSLKTTVSPATKEIPLEALEQYMEIMEVLRGRSGVLEEREYKTGSGEHGLDGPSPDLLQHIHQLCDNQMFVSKVEAVINPSFLAELLSPEQCKDPLTATSELEEEEGLTIDELVQKRLFSEETSNDLNCSDQYGSTPSQSDEDDEVPKEDTRKSLALSSLAPTNSKISHGYQNTSRMTEPSLNATLLLSQVSTSCTSSSLDPVAMDYHSNSKCSGYYIEKQYQTTIQTREQYSKGMPSKCQRLHESPIMNQTVFNGSKSNVIKKESWKKPEASQHGKKDMTQTLISCNQNCMKKFGCTCDKEKGTCMELSKEALLVEEKSFIEPITSTPLPSPSFKSQRDLERHINNCEAKEYLSFHSDPQPKNTESCIGFSCDIFPNELNGQAGGAEQNHSASLNTSTLDISERLVLKNIINPVNKKLQVGCFAEQLGLAPLLTKPFNQCSVASGNQRPPSQRPVSAKARETQRRNKVMRWVNSNDPKYLPTNSRSTSPQSEGNHERTNLCDPILDLTCHEIISSPSYFDKSRGVSQPNWNCKLNVVFPWEISPINSPVQESRMQEKSYSYESDTQYSGISHGTIHSLEESKKAHLKKGVQEVKVSNLLPSYQIKCTPREVSCHRQDGICSTKPHLFSLGDCKGTERMIVCRQDCVQNLPEDEFSGTRAEVPPSTLVANQQHGEQFFGPHTEESLANCCREDEAKEHCLYTCCSRQSLGSWKTQERTSEQKMSVDDLPGLISYKDKLDKACNVSVSPVGLITQERIEQSEVNIVIANGSQRQRGTVTKEYNRQDRFKHNQLFTSALQTNMTSSECKSPDQSTDCIKSEHQPNLSMVKQHMVSQLVADSNKYNCVAGPQNCLDWAFTQVDLQKQIHSDTLLCGEQKEESMQHQTSSPELQLNSVNEVFALCEEVETGDQKPQTNGSKMGFQNTWLTSMAVASQEVVCHSEMMCTVEGTKDVHDKLLSDLDQYSILNSIQCHSATAMPPNSSLTSAYTELGKPDANQWMQQSSKHKTVHMVSPSATGFNEANSDINQEGNFSKSKTVMIISSTSRGQYIMQEPQRLKGLHYPQVIPLQNSIQQDGKEIAGERGKYNGEWVPSAPERILDQDKDSQGQKIFTEACCTRFDERKPEPQGRIWDNNLSLHLKPVEDGNTDVKKETEPHVQRQFQMQSSGHHVPIDAEDCIPLTKECPLGCLGAFCQEVHNNFVKEDKSFDVDQSEAPSSVNTSPPKVLDKLSDMHSQDIGSKGDPCNDKLVLPSLKGSQDQDKGNHGLMSVAKACYTFVGETKQENQKHWCHTCDLIPPLSMKPGGNWNKEVNEELEPSILRQFEIQLPCYNVSSDTEGTILLTQESTLGCREAHFQQVPGKLLKEGKFQNLYHSKAAHDGSTSFLKVSEKLLETQSQEMKAERDKCNGKRVSPALEKSQNKNKASDDHNLIGEPFCTLLHEIKQEHCGHDCDPGPSLNQQPVINEDVIKGPETKMLRKLHIKYSGYHTSSHADETVPLTKESTVECLEVHLQKIHSNLMEEVTCLDINHSLAPDGGSTSLPKVPESFSDMRSQVVGGERDKCKGKLLPTASKRCPDQANDGDRNGLPEICCTHSDVRKQEDQEFCGHNFDLSLSLNLKSVEDSNKDVDKDPESKIQEQFQLQSLCFHVSNNVEEETIPSTMDSPTGCQNVNFKQVHHTVIKIDESLSADPYEAPHGGNTCPPKMVDFLPNMHSQEMGAKGGKHNGKLMLPSSEVSHEQNKTNHKQKGTIEAYCTFLDERKQENNEHQAPKYDLSPSLNLKPLKDGNTYVNKKPEPNVLGLLQMQASYYFGSNKAEVTLPLKKESSLWCMGVHYQQVFDSTDKEDRSIDNGLVEAPSVEKTSPPKVPGKLPDVQCKDIEVERGKGIGGWVNSALDRSQDEDNSSVEQKSSAETCCTHFAESQQENQEHWGYSCEHSPSLHINPVGDESKDANKESLPKSQFQIQSSCFHMSSDAKEETIPITKENPPGCLRVHFQQAHGNLTTEDKCLDVDQCGCPDYGKPNPPKILDFLPDGHRQEMGVTKGNDKWAHPSEVNQGKDSHEQKIFAPACWTLLDERKKENLEYSEYNCPFNVSLNQKPLEDRNKDSNKEPEINILEQFQIQSSCFHVLGDAEEETFPSTKESPQGCLKFHFQQVHGNIIKIDKSLNAVHSEATPSRNTYPPKVLDFLPDMHSQEIGTKVGTHYGIWELPSSGGSQDQDKSSPREKDSIEEEPKQKILGQVQMKSSFYQVLSDKEETITLRKENPIGCPGAYFQQANSYLTKEDSSFHVDNSAAPNDVSKSPSKVLDKLPDMHRGLMPQKSENSSDYCKASVESCKNSNYEKALRKHSSPIGKQTFRIQNTIGVITDPIISMQDLFSVQDFSPSPQCFSEFASFKEEEKKEDADLSQFSTMMIEKLLISDVKHMSTISMSSPTISISSNETAVGVMGTGHRKPEGFFMHEMDYANCGQDNETILAEYTCYQTSYHSEISEESGPATGLKAQDTIHSFEGSGILTRHKKRLMDAQLLRRSKRLKNS